MRSTEISLDRRVIFLARHVLQEQDLYHGYQYSTESAYALVFGYLYGAAIEYLRPEWIGDDRHTDAWNELSDRLSGYQRDNVDFAQLAINEDPFENKALYKDCDEPMIDMWAIGVLLSDNQRDMKFALRTMRSYFKKAFPDAKAALREWNSKSSTWHKACVKSASTLFFPTAPYARFIDSQSPLNNPMVMAIASDHAMDSLKDYVADMDMETDIWVILMIGRGSKAFEVSGTWTMREGDFPEKLTRRVIRNLNALDVTRVACLRCAEPFRPLLIQIYTAQRAGIDHRPLIKDGAPVEDDVSLVATKVLLPMLEEMSKLKEELNNIKVNAMLAAGEYEDRLSEMKKELEETRELTALAEETDKLRIQAAGAEKEAQAAKAEIKRLSAALTKSVSYTQKLEGCLEESEVQRKELDSQLADLMDNRDELVQGETEEQISPSGVRERIGETAYQLLCSKRLAIVGGHTNTHTTLRELFPNWQYYAAEAVLRDTIWAADAVVCITTYTSHKSYHQAKDRARARGLDFVPIPYNGPAAICQQLAEHFAKKGE